MLKKSGREKKVDKGWGKKQGRGLGNMGELINRERVTERRDKKIKVWKKRKEKKSNIEKAEKRKENEKGVGKNW